MKKLLPYPFE